MKDNYHDLFYTTEKNRDEKEIVSDDYEFNENDDTNYEDSFTPNYQIGRTNDKSILR